MRRLERIPTRFFFGDPRLAFIGVAVVVAGREIGVGFDKGDERRVENGVDVGLANVDAASAKTNFGAFWGVPSRVFDRLLGELKMEGSMFSESFSSSKEVGS